MLTGAAHEVMNSNDLRGNFLISATASGVGELKFKVVRVLDCCKRKDSRRPLLRLLSLGERERERK